MIPLALFLLGCTTAYVGAVQVAFAALMRLPLRLNAERAERHGRAEGLGHYLDDPVRLFMPARILQAATVSLVTLIVMVEYGSSRPQTLGLVLGAMLAYIVLCGQVIPLLVARRDPERALELLLPAFEVVARGLTPVTRPLLGLLEGARRERSEVGASTPTTDGAPAGGSNGDQRSEIDEHEERELLRSVVEFGDTLVHEVMTPRPDIVAVKSTSTLAELRATFVEQQYSRIPVYRESLDEILGFVFVKDLVCSRWRVIGSAGGRPVDAARLLGAGDQAGGRPPEGISAAAGPERDRARRVRRHRGSCDDRGPAGGDCRRDSG